MTVKTLKKSVIAVAIVAALTGAYSINSGHALWPPQAAAQQKPGSFLRASRFNDRYCGAGELFAGHERHRCAQRRGRGQYQRNRYGKEFCGVSWFSRA
ncbi:hypothetical protein [Propionivibrio sp.]|uniref:hypothetical protein n=1 Tax=Propionivibrio sp. TaxID=2212460 RepID=UPI0025E04BFD|nr:hypothetical protein [Propionivibrio sp.]